MCFMGILESKNLKSQVGIYAHLSWYLIELPMLLLAAAAALLHCGCFLTC